VRRAALLAGLAALAAAGCGETRTGAEGGQAAPERSTALVDRSKDPPYVNDLARDPGDGSLLLTTNKGFFRIRDGRATPVRGTVTVGGRTAPVGEFLELAAVGPGELLGSGHPDAGDLPQYLGVMRSNDAGRTWQVVSRLGDADIHKFILRHDRLYGWDAVLSAIVVSRDGGRTFEEHFTPRGLVLDFEVDPGDPDTILASTEEQLFRSEDGGERWRAIETGLGIRLAWPSAGRLLRAGEDGTVWASGDAGSSWAEVGRVEGPPADFETLSEDELLLALTDGSVVRTTDGGRTWAPVLRP
jgi:hypothetical protein